MKKISKSLRDIFDFRNKRVNKLLNEITDTLVSIFNKMKEFNFQKLNDLLSFQPGINQKLTQINSDYNRKTGQGTLLVEHLWRKTKRLAASIEKISSLEQQFEIERFYKEFLSYNDHLLLIESGINQLTYQHAAITVMGYVLAFIYPPVGIFSVVISVLLLLSKDMRAKLNGIIIAICAAIIFIYNYVLF